MKRKSAFRQISEASLKKQFGTQDSWRFRSITTPGKSFTLSRALAEFVILQRYGKDVPPLFWYKKTGCYKIRDDFLKIEKQIAAMIYRNEHITALQLLSIVCEKFPPIPQVTMQESKPKKKEKLASKPLIEFKDIETKQETRKAEIQRISQYGQKEKDSTN